MRGREGHGERKGGRGESETLALGTVLAVTRGSRAGTI